ncbi:hypothetical protein HNQ93_001318 [Hymenobacter luteus]|uniref:DUF4349 domain-containing protein n=2 Tax=Hymenobacter TaxID=89966 RepID=A0A7W9SYY0_9BACT|nr:MULTISPECIES: hypothetical protein [Hymenobacter]MBB4601321.1 hypothetical protein [Hymenobacter latericoloratus]MBB6058472.1 hypothetical protein [Hymenobacter luteus]
MPRFRQLLLLFLLLWLAVPAVLLAQTETPAAANKRLFDRTVDELNFRTMETVYDKSFARGKFPVSLRTAKARREFDNFPGRDDLKKLFQNYNSVSDRFKSRFGKGRTDLVEFEKQLNTILVDRNFEFFIRVLPRDERIALIRSLQRAIKQGAAQFNASQDPAPEELAADGAAVPPADIDPASASSANTTPEAVAAEDPQPEPEVALASPATGYAGPRSLDTAPRHDWMDYLNLLLSGSSLLLLLYLVTSVLPDLRSRLDALTEDQELPAPRTRRPAPLPEDRYEDEN